MASYSTSIMACNDLSARRNLPTTTCCFVSTYLRRVGRLGAFRGFAVDITTVALATGTKALLPKLNVTFVKRNAVVLPAAEPYDFCFIDGDHSYNGVRSDYALMGPHCRAAMFHDIRDTSCLAASEYSGGVPLFWQHLQTHLPSRAAAASRTLELTQSGSTFLPMFGIGIVWSGARRLIPTISQ